MYLELDFLICILFSVIPLLQRKLKSASFHATIFSMQLKETQDLEADLKEMAAKRVHSRMICQHHAEWRQQPVQEPLLPVCGVLQMLVSEMLNLNILDKVLFRNHVKLKLLTVQSCPSCH